MLAHIVAKQRTVATMTTVLMILGILTWMRVPMLATKWPRQRQASI